MMRSGAFGLALLGLAAFAAAPAVAETIQIKVADMAFTPARVSAHVGDTIEWVNSDFVAHTATSRNKMGRDKMGRDKAGGDKEWDVTIPANRRGQVTLEHPGAIDYYCRFHPNMVGQISVTR